MANRRLYYYLGILFMLGCMSLQAQLSPGKLSKAHSHLEGLSNCTQCHTVGEKIENNKCLSCHETLASRIKSNKGFHVSAAVKGKDCIVCHSEHHGLAFKMIRFENNKFDHNQTGYRLEGAHQRVKDCRECHKPDHIASTTIRKNVNTYLGLDPKCTSCHDDYHQNTLSSKCTDCHNMETFEKAPKFAHQNTSFPLLGVHKSVECKACHEITLKNGKTFQAFAGIKHQNCNACHNDPHKGSFGANCKSCHSEESFHSIKANSNFNHESTGFALKGKHKVADCRKCHDNRDGGTADFQEFKSWTTYQCAQCHNDVHENKFGNDCAQCHDESSFKSNKASTNIDHNLTAFPLTGKHEKVECKSCHKSDFTSALAHNKCMDCHSDYHKGEFSASPFGQECGTCHSTSGFDQSSFTMEQHTLTRFQLTGSHLATPCFACHFKTNEWKFSNLGMACKDCHNNIHEGFISETFMGQQECQQCHQTDNWLVSSFDHHRTDFTLLGKHQQTSCQQCHFPKDANGNKNQRFKDLTAACITCHENVHGDQFMVNGGIDCKKCHGFDNWDPLHFDHNTTRFKLEGAHIELKCDACHKPEIINGKRIVVYKLNKLNCKDCHQ